MRALIFLPLVLLSCSHPEPPVESIVIPKPQADTARPLLNEATKTQREAAFAAKKKDSNADLIQMLRLSKDLNRSIRVWRAHRTHRNETKVRGAIRALRGVTRK